MTKSNQTKRKWTFGQSEHRMSCEIFIVGIWGLGDYVLSSLLPVFNDSTAAAVITFHFNVDAWDGDFFPSLVYKLSHEQTLKSFRMG